MICSFIKVPRVPSIKTGAAATGANVGGSARAINGLKTKGIVENPEQSRQQT
jgi:hypothetical protein